MVHSFHVYLGVLLKILTKLIILKAFGMETVLSESLDTIISR